MATTVLGLKTFTASDPVDYNEINDNYNKIDNGVKTAMQGRAAHNLLDNSWFVDPVNQRGMSSVVDNWKYIVDRWVCTNVSSNAPVIVNDNGITLNNTSGTQTQAFRQYLNIKDGTYTAAAKTDSAIWIKNFRYSNGGITNISSSFDGKGQIYVATSGNNIYIAIQAFTGYSIKVVWVALYEGSYTADTIPAYVPKGYAAELAECQRYYWRYWQNNNFDIGHGYMNTTDTANITFDFPTKMRIAPTITIGDISTLKVMCVNGLKGTTASSVVKTTDKQMMVGFTLDSTSTAFTPCIMRSNSGTTIEFSADL